VLTLNQVFVALSLSFTGSPIHPPLGALTFVIFWPASLPVNPIRKSRVQSFLKTGSTGFGSGSTEFGPGRVFGWVPQWTENSLVETGSTGLRTDSTGFESTFLNDCQILGDPLYTPHTLSLHSLLLSPRFLGWPTFKQEHSIHLSHPNSHLLQSFEGPLVWGEVDLTHCWFYLDSPILFILSSLQT
jgi:hypothetical protein